MAKATLGLIVGNRGFFADNLVKDGRKVMLKLLKEMDIDVVVLDEKATKLGAVESLADSLVCADLFDAKRKEIEGILVTLPNFGDEKGIAEAIKRSGLNVPIFLHAFPDDIHDMSYHARRDSFCGKLSVANNFYQYGIPYTITANHTIDPETAEFKQEINDFVAVCKVVNGMRKARIGVIGARPNAFQTVRFSEKVLEDHGINVSTADLSEILGVAGKLADDDPKVKARLDDIKKYLDASKAPADRLMRMAKFGTALSEWINANDVDMTAIQCWDSLQHNLGINPCTIMSMMSQELMPSACEGDALGALSMYALTLAGGKPSALVDWNNNYINEPDKCVLFHCGNWPVEFYKSAEMVPAEVLGSTLGQENTWGAISGRVKAGPMGFARLVTDDRFGAIKAIYGDGFFTDDYIAPVIGSHAIIEIKGLPEFLYHLARNGFVHHGAITTVHTARILDEAFKTYLGFDAHYHGVD